MQAKMLVCLSIMLVLFGNSATANEAIRIRSIYSDQTGNVSIVVDVPPGNNPEASQFQLIEDNKKTVKASSVRPFTDSDWKLAVIFCVDKSGSISDTELEQTKTALKNLLRKPLFRKQDRLALVSFENEPRVIQWFSQPQEIYKKINELENMNGRHTVLYDTLFDSLGYLNSDSIDASPPVFKRILVITDGQNDGGLRQNTTEVRDKALEMGVAIDAVLLNAKKKNVETMRSLADDTGGKFVSTDGKGVETALNKIFSEILGESVVYFQRSIDTAAPKTTSVGVQFQKGNEMPISDSVQARIPETKVEQTQPAVSNAEGTPQPTTMPKEKDRFFDWRWWYFIFLMFAALLALLIWRSRKKPRAGPEDLEPKVEFNPTPPAPTSSSSPPNETKRRKTLVGSPSFSTLNSDSPIATLVCLSGPQKGQRFSVEKELFHIGAKLDNDLCITQDEYVSGDHAYLRYENGSLLLFDKGSRNGTFVDDAQVADTGLVLKPGEQIRIGTSVFEVVIPAD